MAHGSLGISRLVIFGDSLSDSGNLFHLIGIPQPPDWRGHFSNGPVYAEQLARWLKLPLEDRAFGGADASNTSPLPINLSGQIAGYLAHLRGHTAPPHTAALINIGSNDYEAILSQPSLDPKAIQTLVGNVVGSIAQAIDTLTSAGVAKIILFTLPDLGITPAARSLGPDVVAFAHALVLANNAALEQMAASRPNVEMVDAFQLSEAVFADPQSFGFNAHRNATWVHQLAAHSTQFAPNEIAFFDSIHPTTAAHGVLAAFADAVLSSGSVQYLDGTQPVIHAGHGDSFIFAAPIDPTKPSLNGNYTIYGGPGNDIIFAGSGNVTVHGGSGTDLIAAGSGNALLEGGAGADLLETNSFGTNTLVGGSGGDVLIANRAGRNSLRGGSGNDLFVIKESFPHPHGSFNFGRQDIIGGSGHDTLRFIINNQHPWSWNAPTVDFLNIESAFDSAARHHHAGTFTVDRLHVSGIERIELQVDTVSTDPNTPYLITHRIVLADGDTAPIAASLNHLLQTAEHWNLLTV